MSLPDLRGLLRFAAGLAANSCKHAAAKMSANDRRRIQRWRGREAERQTSAVAGSDPGRRHDSDQGKADREHSPSAGRLFE